ncbi:MAG: hypothetical protein WD053_09490 [Gracilimonas sp.]
MDLEAHYKQLWDSSIHKFRSGEFNPDQKIDAPSDDRYGLTLLIRPSLDVRLKITEMLNDLKPYAPDQYYYPVSDMHITALSIISCQSGFSLDQIDDVGEYIPIIRSAIDHIAPFQIKFQGLTASPSALMICGYPENNSLDELRNSLRTSFKQTSLFHTIDKRYKLMTAHITALRFRTKVSDQKNFVKKLRSLEDTLFGADPIQELELVGNDWYQRRQRVTLIEKYII